MINGHFSDEETDAPGHSAQRARARVLTLNFYHSTIPSLREKYFRTLDVIHSPRRCTTYIKLSLGQSERQLGCFVLFAFASVRIGQLWVDVMK